MAVSRLDDWALIASSIGAGGNAFPVSAGDDRVLLFKVANAGATAVDITSVTYGGQAMTEVGSQDTTSSRDMHSSLWILDEAGIAAATDDDFDWSPTTGVVQFRAFAACYQDVDQTTPQVDSDATNATGGAEPATPSLTTVADGFVVATFSHNRGTEEATDPDVTWANVAEQIENIGSQTYNSIADSASSGTSLDPNFSASNLFQASHYIAVALRPAVATVTVDGAASGFLPTVAASIDVGGVDVDGPVAGFLPTVAAQLDVEVEVDAPVAGFLPTVAAQIDLEIEIDAPVSGFLPTVAANLTALQSVDAPVVGFLPTPSAQLFTVNMETAAEGIGHGADQMAQQMMEANLRAIDVDEQDLMDIMPAMIGAVVKLKK